MYLTNQEILVENSYFRKDIINFFARKALVCGRVNNTNKEDKSKRRTESEIMIQIRQSLASNHDSCLVSILTVLDESKALDLVNF